MLYNLSQTMLFFEKKSRKIPVNDLLIDLESELLNVIEEEGFLVEMSVLKKGMEAMRIWGKNTTADLVEKKLKNKNKSKIEKGNKSKKILKKAEKLINLEKEIRKACDKFADDEENFPTTIDPNSYHVRVIINFFGDLNNKKTLDLGCGKGRFLRVMKDEYPKSKLWGLDISPRMLKSLPKGARAVQGIMTNVPFKDSTFDNVFASQSLEHAVEIEEAVREMCRVTKKGGKIVIIDKSASKWGKLSTPHWEKWFGKRELENILSKYCRIVKSEFIPYSEGARPDKLFIAWKAIK